MWLATKSPMRSFPHLPLEWGWIYSYQPNGHKEIYYPSCTESAGHVSLGLLWYLPSECPRNALCTMKHMGKVSRGRGGCIERMARTFDTSLLPCRANRTRDVDVPTRAIVVHMYRTGNWSPEGIWHKKEVSPERSGHWGPSLPGPCLRP